MANDIDPIVGRWYENIDNEEKFEVVSLDEDTGFVTIRHYDGDNEELDIDIWYGLDIVSCPDPDAPVDDLVVGIDDDFGDDDDDLPEGERDEEDEEDDWD